MKDKETYRNQYYKAYDLLLWIIPFLFEKFVILSFWNNKNKVNEYLDNKILNM